MINEDHNGELLEIDDWQTPDSGRYGDIKELKDMILHKKIVKVDKDGIELENGIFIIIECSESDCCAATSGYFEFDEYDIPIDALITEVVIGKQINVPDSDTTVRRNTITMFHNQNPVVLANAETDAGNDGYYYSVTSLVVSGVHFPFVEA